MFDINNVFLEVLGYPLSYIELIGIFFGLLSVYWASRRNILTWPAGIINEFFFFILFFQVQLYANMFLQVIFFITTLYGWYSWRKLEEEKTKITRLSIQSIVLLIPCIVIGSYLLGIVNGNLHHYLPQYFTEAAASPFADAIILVLSITATILLALKKLENWVFWMINNLFCIALYYQQSVYFISLEYIVFLGIAAYGLYGWIKAYSNE